MYAALPPDMLRDKASGAARVDFYGREAVELIIGAEFTGQEEDILWVLVHNVNKHPCNTLIFTPYPHLSCAWPFGL
eukprot:7684101-Pyramimonas_sp.AAC.1